MADFDAESQVGDKMEHAANRRGRVTDEEKNTDIRDNDRNRDNEDGYQQPDGIVGTTEDDDSPTDNVEIATDVDADAASRTDNSDPTPSSDDDRRPHQDAFSSGDDVNEDAEADLQVVADANVDVTSRQKEDDNTTTVGVGNVEKGSQDKPDLDHPSPNKRKKKATVVHSAIGPTRNNQKVPEQHTSQTILWYTKSP